MGLLDFDLTGPADPMPQQVAVIAFSGDQGLSTAILWCSPELRADLKNNGCSPDDCFPPDKGPGVYVWEGAIVGIEYPSTPNGPAEYDVEYRGELRDLTDLEWACLRAGQNPLKVTIPDGLPGVRDADAPCTDFQPGKSSGTCEGDGHHLCKECQHFAGGSIASGQP